MLVHSWIMNSVECFIYQNIMFLENAIDVLLELKERFSQGDYIRISELQCKIFSLKQESRSVSEFFYNSQDYGKNLKLTHPHLFMSVHIGVFVLLVSAMLDIIMI